MVLSQIYLNDLESKFTATILSSHSYCFLISPKYHACIPNIVTLSSDSPRNAHSK